MILRLNLIFTDDPVKDGSKKADSAAPGSARLAGRRRER
jgi:hypothetical protein